MPPTCRRHGPVWPRKVTLRVSAKLGGKIHYQPTQTLPLDGNLYADWSAHLFTAERSQYILITNTKSLYSMVMYGAGITDDSTLIQHTTRYISDVLRDAGLQLIHERVVIPATAHVRFSRALNRSVTGTMNELVACAKDLLLQGISPFDASVPLNEIPLSILDHGISKEAFTAMPPPQG